MDVFQQGLGCTARRAMLSIYTNRPAQGKANGTFRGDDNITAARVGTCCRSAARARQAADESPLAPASKAADECAQAGTAADEPSGPLAAPFVAFHELAAVHAVISDVGQGDAEYARSLEVTAPARTCDLATDRGAPIEDSGSAHGNWCIQNAAEG